MCVFMYTCIYMHICLCVHQDALRDRKWMLNPMELGLQVVIRCKTLVLETELWSSRSAVSFLKWKALSPATNDFPLC